MRKIQFLIIAVLFGYSFSAMAQTLITFSTSSVDGILTQSQVNAQRNSAVGGVTTDYTAEFDNSVTGIGTAAFSTNPGRLISVTFNNNITSIEERAFVLCAGLTSITIPASITNIGDRAFSSCRRSAIITFEGITPPTLGTDAFSDAGIGISGTEIPTINLPNATNKLDWYAPLLAAGISDAMLRANGIEPPPSNKKTILRIGGKMKVGKGTKIIMGPP